MTTVFLEATVAVLLLLSFEVLSEAGSGENIRQRNVVQSVLAVEHIGQRALVQSEHPGENIRKFVHPGQNVQESLHPDEHIQQSVLAGNEEEQIIQEVVRDSSSLFDDISEQKGKLEGCPVTCFRTDPVCGVNGVTFWCGAKDAECNGVEVSHVGYCRLGNGGALGKGSMAGQALLLVHMVWLILAGILVILGLP
ncbi:hypothetical protein O6H91_Y184400 [Diphasiastrum complanatum]|nr:hypothetical protein O6H91_Y184400 [Diphasiastrum complanatum]